MYVAYPDFHRMSAQDRHEVWRGIASTAPWLKDNRYGVRAMIESGGIADPATLWVTTPNAD